MKIIKVTSYLIALCFVVFQNCSADKSKGTSTQPNQKPQDVSIAEERGKIFKYLLEFQEKCDSTNNDSIQGIYSELCNKPLLDSAIKEVKDNAPGLYKLSRVKAEELDMNVDTILQYYLIKEFFKKQ